MVARRPTKAAETGPHMGSMPIGPDGERLNFPEVFEKPVRWRRIWIQGGKLVPDLNGDWPAAVSPSLAAACAGALPDGWAESIGVSLNEYRIARAKELDGADESDVVEAIRQIEAAARKLKGFADFPKSKGAIFEAAWRRIDHAHHDYDDGATLHDVLYPGLSLLTARLAVLRRRARTAPTEVGSLRRLIRCLAAFVEAHGGRATGSNGIVRSSQGDSLTVFARAVKACLLSVALPPPCKMTDSAINQAVVTALKSRGDDPA